MRLVDSLKLLELQNTPKNIRNICIVAHVDHGKTTLADALISSNGIISQRMSGKLRYMDSRPDEQERGITMKSSSIALYHVFGKEEYLVNLIDSPGHIDFSSEVSTAVRLCDGAIVVVDVVEGVCPQTRLALKQAYSENISAVLVLNKIDRLILEMQMTPLDAYVHLSQILEQVNAVMGELFATEVFENEENTLDKQLKSSEPEVKDDNNYYDWTSGLEDADDSNLYFSPEQGNVVFASAIDGWGFTVQTFTKMFSDKLGVKEEILQKVLWGDFYLNSKTKRFMKGAQEKAKKPLFVQLVLDNLWNVYETIVLRNEKEKVPVICEKLGIKLTTRDLRHTDSRVQLQSLMMQWLPLSVTVMNMICKKLPSPKNIIPEKVEKLMCSKIRDFESYSTETQKLKEDFLACDNSADRPLIIFISKMFSVDKSILPENKPKALTPEEMAKRREIARKLREDKKQTEADSTATPMTNESLPSIDENKEEIATEDEKDQPAFIAFARVFSGKVKKGDKVYVLGPKHDPSKILNPQYFNIDPNKKLKDLKSDEHVMYTEIKSLYIMMGRELEEIDYSVAGNVIGIGGLDEYVLKTATLSSTVMCPSFSEIQSAAVPILRVAIEPTKPSQMHQLEKGLKLLNQSDSCVQVLLQETGEHVLVTAGEVHLERCLADLKNHYAKVPITVSEPIVPFRETIVEPPKIDMTNEEIDSQNIDKGNKDQDPTVLVYTNNKQSRIKIRAKPLPNEITDLLEKSNDLLKAISQHIKYLQGTSKNTDTITTIMSELDINSEKQKLSDRMLKLIEHFKEELQSIASKLDPEWKDIVTQIWSVGPRNCGPNVLLNHTTDYATKFINHDLELVDDPRFEYESSFVNGFQLASLAGPLCEEPMRGVAFCVEEWTLDKSEGDDSTQTFGPLSGQIMSAVKDGCRKAFQIQPQRLMAAMYSCDIIVNQKVLDGCLKMWSPITITAIAILGYANSATVQIEQGTLLGQQLELSTGDGTFYSFKGIPYAKPPTGNLRFKAPEDPEPWTGVKNTTAHGSNCPQFDILNQVLVPGSEDCLFLNVYTPEITPETPLPVMFFIHGGGFEFLSGDDTYFGPDFIVGKDVVLVTINYRLSALGFLSLDTEEVPGNAGLKDQVAALKWVKQNIANFGGDPDNITIFGQSAGAASVSLFLLSPLASGLFNRAILMSGSTLDEWVEPFEPRRRAFALGKSLGINTTDTTELLDYLRSLPAEDIVGHYISLNAMESKANIFGKMFPWGPVVEQDFGLDHFLTEDPSNLLKNGNVVNDVDLMFGHGSQEMIFSIEYFFNDFIPLYQEWPELFVPRNILNVADQKTILELSDIIQQHYFGNETLSWETVPQFTQYLSDGNFVYEITRFVQNLPFGAHSRFAYIFACESERNIFGNLGAAYNVTGFSHGDDFFYLFDAKAASSLPLNKTSTTYKMVDNIVTTFTNFAKYGTPTPDDCLGVEWPQYDLETRAYLEFTEEITAGTDMDAEMEEFWQSVLAYANIDHFLQTNFN